MVVEKQNVRIVHNRGTVYYVGNVHWSKDIMIGVVYDKPVGKHDGIMKNKRYFRCSPKHGVLEKASHFESILPEIGRRRKQTVEIPGTRFQVYKEKMRQSYQKSQNDAPYNDVTFLIGKNENRFVSFELHRRSIAR